MVLLHSSSSSIEVEVAATGLDDEAIDVVIEVSLAKARSPGEPWTAHP